ncbi:MAG: CDP-alcohol phosphatidyltransferase family protein [Candidatus Aminicenantes bacterium]|nr:CDP-alcohol phosphatidyltransferase family protein [Candidatus Aminicenantes bacterium]
MSLFSDFKSSTKGVPVDEIVDLVFYRPLSYIVVKLVQPLPVKPNQLSFIAMSAGIASGVYFSLGTPVAFFLGGLFCFLANIFDCSDGMLARLKSEGSVTGRIIDGVVGHIMMLSIYTGLAIGLLRAGRAGLIDLPLSPLILVGLAAFGHFVKAALADNFASQYATHVLGRDCIPQLEIEFFGREMERLKEEGRWSFDRAIVGLYLAYTRFQLGPRPKPFIRYDAEEYKRHNHLLVMLWNLAGPSMHMFMIFISAMLFKPRIFLIYAVFLSSIWVLILVPIQALVNRKLKDQF